MMTKQRFRLPCLLLLALASHAFADDLEPIKKAPLTKRVSEVKLAAPFEQMCVGAGGRFLIFYVPTIRQVAIFDTNVAKVVKYLPASDNNLRIAAGADKLIVAYGDKQVIARWSLNTFKRELSTTLDVPSGVATMAMGSASNGPLLIARKGQAPYGSEDKGLVFLEIDQLRPIPTTFPKVNLGTNEWSDQTSISASADGQRFLLRQTKPVVLRRRGSVAEIAGMADSSRSYGTGGPTFLGPGGRFVYSPLGIFTSEFNQVHRPPTGQSGLVRIPAVQGNYCLTVSWPTLSQNNHSAPTIQLGLAGSPEPLVSVRGIDPFEGGERPSHPAHIPDLSSNLLLVSDAKLLVHIPVTKDKLVLHRFDLDEVLAEHEIDYLFVNSQAPHEAQPGGKFEYGVDVKSKAGGLRFSLMSAPDGMTLSEAGLVSWNVPGDFDYSDVHVILQIEDELGQQLLHTFRIATGGAKGTAPVGTSPTLPSTAEPADENPFKIVGETQDFGQLPIIEPVRVNDKKRINLPATAEDIKLGGGGRYLILYFKSLSNLGVFDVSAGKLVGYIPISGAQVGFAAGANRLIVVSSDLGIISRWNLVTQKRELTRSIAARGPLAHVLMGHASAGPAFVSFDAGGHNQTETYRVDLKSLRATPIFQEDTGVSRRPGNRTNAKISATGTTLSVWEMGVSPSGLQTYVRQGDSYRGFYQHKSVGSIIPSAEGNHVFTNAGIFTNQLVAKSKDRGFLYSPAAHGSFYLRVASQRSLRSSRQASSVTLHVIGDDRPILKLPVTPYLHEQDNWGRAPLTMEQRMILVPEANAIVIVPPTRDHLMVHHFELDEALRESGLDYLFVSSQPQFSLEFGEEFDYSIQVKSKQGGVKFKLESAPAGMKVDSRGRVTWQVPVEMQTPHVTAIVSIQDKSGQEILHTLSMSVPGVNERLRLQKIAEQKRQEAEQHAARVAAMRLQQEQQAAAMRKAKETRDRSQKWLAERAQAIAMDDASKPEIEEAEAYVLRNWTDRNGTTLAARFVKVFAGSVFLQLPDGSIVSVTEKELSDPDMTYVDDAVQRIGDRQKQLTQLDAERIKRQGELQARTKLAERSRSNLKQIMLAILQYEDTYRRLPITASYDSQTGMPLLSWRVQLLPFLEEQALYDDFHHHEPWFSDHNRTLIPRMPSIFQPPGSAAPEGRTTYVAVTGNQCAFGPVEDPKTRGRIVRLANIVRGTSNTAAVIEASDLSAVTWTRPDDIMVKSLDDHRQVSSWFGLRDDGLLVGYLDAQVRTMLRNNDPQAIVEHFSIAAAQRLPLRFAEP